MGAEVMAGLGSASSTANANTAGRQGEGQALNSALAGLTGGGGASDNPYTNNTYTNNIYGGGGSSSPQLSPTIAAALTSAGGNQSSSGIDPELIKLLRGNSSSGDPWLSGGRGGMNE